MLIRPDGRSPRLPLAFMGLGLLSLVTLGAVFLLGLPSIAGAWFRNPWALVATHLFTLGFGTPIIMGAFYQLVPVLAETPLRYAKLGWVHYGLHVTGYLVLLAGFCHLATGLMIAGGTLLFTGAILFVWSMVATLKRAPKWHIALTFICVALLYLLLVFSLGLTLALNWQYGFLGAATRTHLIDHAIWGFGGWFTLTILGVALKLVPLFTLTHEEPGRLALPVLILFNIGMTIALWWRATGLLLMALATAIYLVEMLAILRKRVRRVWDISLRYAGHGLFWLALSSALLIYGAFAGLKPAHAVGALYGLAIGWVGHLIIGHLFKIIPFLIWTHRYADKAGKEPIPMLTDLYNQKRALALRFVLSGGCLGVVAGLWAGWLWLAQAGALVSLIGSICTAVEFFGIWRGKHVGNTH
jgi:hypothetical protein